MVGVYFSCFSVALCLTGLKYWLNLAVKKNQGRTIAFGEDY